jgi:hypothetical protein
LKNTNALYGYGCGTNMYIELLAYYYHNFILYLRVLQHINTTTNQKNIMNDVLLAFHSVLI